MAQLTNFRLAPASVMEESVALIWDKPEQTVNVTEYVIYTEELREEVLIDKNYSTEKALEGTGKTEALVLEIEKNAEATDNVPTGDVFRCQCTDATIENLKSDTKYQFLLQAVDDQGNVCMEAGPITVRTKKQGAVCNILDYGAMPVGTASQMATSREAAGQDADNTAAQTAKGRSLNTENRMATSAIQRAIDACPRGGRVVIPAGTFVTGALFLKSDMTLYLEEGAVLLGSDDPTDYPLMEYRWEGREKLCYASLLNSKNMENGERLTDITIAGKGVINANGTILKKKELAENKGARGRAICIRNADRVYLKDITVRQSPAWCVHPIYCKDVTMNHISVHTKFDEAGNRYDVFNGDGIDPDSCQNVTIIHSLIASQDDCIAVKSGRDEDGRKVGIPTENVRITNCTFLSGFGVAMGSEMSGGIRNVLVQDCTFHNVYSIGSVKTPRGRGSIVENVLYDNCTLVNESTEHHDCRWFRGAIYIDQFYSHDQIDPLTMELVNEGTPIIRNITFRNCKARTIAGNAVFIAGLPESPLQDIVLQNVEAEGLESCKIYNAGNIRLENVKFFAHNL